MTTKHEPVEITEEMERVMNAKDVTPLPLADPEDFDAEAAGNEVAMRRARKAMEADLEIDLEEVAPRPINIVFQEWETRPILLTNGAEFKLNGEVQMQEIIVERVASISTYVPVEMFVKIAAMKSQLMKLSLAAKSGDDEAGSAEQMVQLQMEFVYAVWKLSEPGMTMARFKRGLPYKKVRALFSRFFGNLTD